MHTLSLKISTNFVDFGFGFQYKVSRTCRRHNMVTSFGKALWKLRIDRGMVLKNMADMLGVSSAYLSAIELGKRAIPDSLVNSVAAVFGLSGQEANDLRKQAEISQPSLKVDMSDAEDQNKELMLVFARKFKDLSPEQLDKLNKMLKD